MNRPADSRVPVPTASAISSSSGMLRGQLSLLPNHSGGRMHRFCAYAKEGKKPSGHSRAPTCWWRLFSCRGAPAWARLRRLRRNETTGEGEGRLLTFESDRGTVEPLGFDQATVVGRSEDGSLGARCSARQNDDGSAVVDGTGTLRWFLKRILDRFDSLSLAPSADQPMFKNLWKFPQIQKRGVRR